MIVILKQFSIFGSFMISGVSESELSLKYYDVFKSLRHFRHLIVYTIESPFPSIKQKGKAKQLKFQARRTPRETAYEAAGSEEEGTAGIAI